MRDGSEGNLKGECADSAEVLRRFFLQHHIKNISKAAATAAFFIGVFMFFTEGDHGWIGLPDFSGEA